MRPLSVLAILLISLSTIAQQLPDFEFETADGIKVNKSSLMEGKPVIVFYFDPFCDHCQRQAEEIKSNKEKFAGINLVWASWAEHTDNEDFREVYFPDFKNTTVCLDYKFKFDDWFGYSEVPSIYCYNSKWERVASFKEEQLADALLKAVQ